MMNSGVLLPRDTAEGIVDSVKKIIKDGQTTAAEKYIALQVLGCLTSDSQGDDGK